MRLPTRVIAGSFALVAMTLALAQTVVAGTCAPGMDMQTMDAQVHAMDTHVMDMQPAATMTGPSPTEGPSLGDEADATDEPCDHDERHCPFGPASMSQGCGGAASLPSHVTQRLASSVELFRSVHTESGEHDLLLATTPFHPPRP